MKTMIYPSLDLLPALATADATTLYLAANTGTLYFVGGTSSAPKYVELPVNMSTPNNPIIGPIEE